MIENLNKVEHLIRENPQIKSLGLSGISKSYFIKVSKVIPNVETLSFGYNTGFDGGSIIYMENMKTLIAPNGTIPDTIFPYLNELHLDHDSWKVAE